MNDMTTEQALEWLEGLRNTTGDQVCAEIEAGKAAEAAQAFRAALSRPALQQKPALEWSKTLMDGKPVTFKQAEKAVAELGDGWRLPTKQELESLPDLSRYDPAIDVEKYPDTKSCAYWTSTPCACNPDAARWVVDFSDGNVYGGPRGIDACVRAVRAGLIEETTDD